MSKINVVGIPISTTSYEGVVKSVNQWLTQRTAQSSHAKYICVTSVHGIITARTDEQLRAALNDADIATPDGMPVVWALRSFGATEQRRVYGPTLMLRLCEAAARRGSGIFLYGGRPEVLPQLRQRLSAKVPGLKIAGMYSPPFRPLSSEEDAEIIRMIRESGADLIFVGISTPKQEKWMADHRDHFPGTVMTGVGAAFDFHAGRVKQAPAWIQRAGFEWLFRLTMEPARLWRRYLLVTPQFLPLWGLQKVRSVLEERSAG
ncbi:MAG: WecB/TagA/CpsF family glycosyltransferase [Acidobacteriota bacterium]|nr:WecB/TagA/CpsF family glycosyltransferase [Acidobacteriota bacterium]